MTQDNSKPSEAFRKLSERAKTIGIDMNVIVAEVNRLIELRTTAIAGYVVDQIVEKKLNIDNLAAEVSQKVAAAAVDIDALAEKVAGKVQTASVDIDALAEKVAGKVQTASVDIDALAAKVAAAMPEPGELDQKMIENNVTVKVVAAINSLEERLQAAIIQAVDAKFAKDTEQLVQSVNKLLADKLEDLTKNPPEGVAAGGGSRFEQILPIIEKIIDKQSNQGGDILSQLDAILTLKNKLSVLDGNGPDVTAQFRANQQVLMEGIKIGAKAAGKNPLSPSGGASVKQPGYQSSISRLIANL